MQNWSQSESFWLKNVTYSTIATCYLLDCINDLDSLFNQEPLKLHKGRHDVFIYHWDKEH